MIRGTTLHRRPVIDLDAGERLGDLAEVLLDPPLQCVAALVVTPCQSPFSSRQEVVLPASVVQAVKPDAITVRRAGAPDRAPLPRADLSCLSQLTGRTVVSWSGAVLGVLDDVLIDDENGRILGYPLRAAHFLRAVERWLAGESAAQRWDYVRADAGLQVDYILVRVPDDAVVRGRVEAPLEDDVSRAPAIASGWAPRTLGRDDQATSGVLGERDAEPLVADVVGYAAPSSWGRPAPLPRPAWGRPSTPRSER
jgi:sporulation protein YlmC with PRC-barrel domain